MFAIIIIINQNCLIYKKRTQHKNKRIIQNSRKKIKLYKFRKSFRKIPKTNILNKHPILNTKYLKKLIINLKNKLQFMQDQRIILKKKAQNSKFATLLKICIFPKLLLYKRHKRYFNKQQNKCSYILKRHNIIRRIRRIFKEILFCVRIPKQIQIAYRILQIPQRYSKVIFYA
ncbi:hypothetical protein IMG5_117880 [Ichthyophthirius multifiliis]|uniref:Uncharacterized protein n=1 Tax=Ichthyophthirius multifiliis TaxID=5932 RepID=G0QUL7_ICHMU|nr:hypothetical protein IMG5_117880 [Ichthyophthirius multifiliis]EGR31063.1 hypothetical protein IMG5_117880 [Ichthyophthirius multifiliis]|eukprot:XP_004034549.1 hypothetical protein IMG5_117880 [Ichthyophthirius multifiliis]